MNRLVFALLLGVVLVAMLTSAGPTLVGLARVAVPVVVAVGVVVVAVRLVWYFTQRY
jgi:hypothetical protein